MCVREREKERERERSEICLRVSLKTIVPIDYEMQRRRDEIDP